MRLDERQVVSDTFSEHFEWFEFNFPETANYEEAIEADPQIIKGIIRTARDLIMGKPQGIDDATIFASLHTASRGNALDVEIGFGTNCFVVSLYPKGPDGKRLIGASTLFDVTGATKH